MTADTHGKDCGRQGLKVPHEGNSRKLLLHAKTLIKDTGNSVALGDILYILTLDT